MDGLEVEILSPNALSLVRILKDIRRFRRSWNTFIYQYLFNIDKTKLMFKNFKNVYGNKLVF